MAIAIWPWIGGSAGARALQERLHQQTNGRESVKFLRPRMQTGFTPRNRHIPIINWGNAGDYPTNIQNRILNRPEAVRRASNKEYCFNLISENQHELNTVQPIPFTRDRAVAEQWLEDGDRVVGRSLRSGSSGRGIFLINSMDEMVRCPLYTKYAPKIKEYRIHLIRRGPANHVHFVQQKRRTYNVDENDVNWQIRTHDNGFIYAVDNVDELPPEVFRDARQYMDILRLDFAALDIIYNRRHDQYYFLEANTAPGLAGSVVQFYGDVLFEICREVQHV